MDASFAMAVAYQEGLQGESKDETMAVLELRLETSEVDYFNAEEPLFGLDNEVLNFDQLVNNEIMMSEETQSVAISSVRSNGYFMKQEQASQYVDELVARRPMNLVMEPVNESNVSFIPETQVQVRDWVVSEVNHLQDKYIFIHAGPSGNILGQPQQQQQPVASSSRIKGHANPIGIEAPVNNNIKYEWDFKQQRMSGGQVYLSWAPIGASTTTQTNERINESVHGDGANQNNITNNRQGAIPKTFKGKSGVGAMSLGKNLPLIKAQKAESKKRIFPKAEEGSSFGNTSAKAIQNEASSQIVAIRKKPPHPKQLFNCSYCNKGFYQRTMTRRHETIHMGKDLTYCPFEGCGIPYKCSHTCKKHYKIAHQQQIQGLPS